ncbi:MAG TPA: hypothetical protein VGR93_02515 [Candidatus Acidoferrales bacterium]|nr:hypothetical protein [Candidatus Acidoferrales bacterium]
MSKCHPAIFELASLLKECIEATNQLGPNAPKELIEKIEAKIDNGSQQIMEKYSGPVQPTPNTFAAQIIFSDAAFKSDSDEQGIAEWIHFQRHKIPAKVDAEGRARKDYDAGRRTLRTASDLEQLRCGKGPLRPFKGDLDHQTMFEALWGFGIEKLSPEELADFFDSYCPCGLGTDGSEVHDPDALKKQKARFQKILRRAVED